MILIAAAGLMFRHSRKTKIDPNNVNEEWDGGLHPKSADRRVQDPRQRLSARRHREHHG